MAGKAVRQICVAASLNGAICYILLFRVSAPNLQLICNCSRPSLRSFSKEKKKLPHSEIEPDNVFCGFSVTLSLIHRFLIGQGYVTHIVSLNACCRPCLGNVRSQKLGITNGTVYRVVKGQSTIVSKIPKHNNQTSKVNDHGSR